MIRLFRAGEAGLEAVVCAEGDAIPEGVFWIDLVSPTREEEKKVEAHIGIEVPTREEMMEIEASSRLYSEDGVLYMTATVLAKADSDSPQAADITFILAPAHLVSVRYAEPRPFTTFAQRIQRPGHACRSAEATLFGLLEAIIDRTADIIERLSVEIDGISQEIFREDAPRRARGQRFHEVLRHLGRTGDLMSKARESLGSVGRLITFLGLEFAPGPRSTKDQKARLKTMTRDVISISDHIAFMSNKVNLLLDATLGMINIEQNAIIKIFSVAAVVFLPPTLIASVYGMNFEFMPELHWLFGYPFAIGLMVVSAILPYLYFKRRGWL
jgi:magnesium transporter